MSRSVGVLLILVSVAVGAPSCVDDDSERVGSVVTTPINVGTAPEAGATATTAAAPTTEQTPTTTLAPTPTVNVEALTRFLEDRLAESSAEGGLVAVSKGGADSTIVSAGVTDASRATPVPIDGALPVASITKSYVAAVLLSLQRDGLVELDDPLGDYVDWPDGEAITVRQLLDHTSGVGPWGNATDPTSRFLDTVLSDLTTNRTLSSVVESLRDVEPIGQPGFQTYYSNLNYLLAGRVAEVASGLPFARLLTERITTPLELASTYYPAGESPTSGPAPLPGRFEFEEGVVVSTTAYPNAGFLSLLGPSAAGISSADDLMRWGDALFRERRLGPVDLSPMLDVRPGGYGLGVAGVDRAAGSCVFEGCPAGAKFEVLALNGEVPGSSTRLWYDPSTDTLVLLYLNRDGSELDGPMLELLALARTP